MSTSAGTASRTVLGGRLLAGAGLLAFSTLVSWQPSGVTAASRVRLQISGHALTSPYWVVVGAGLAGLLVAAVRSPAARSAVRRAVSRPSDALSAAAVIGALFLTLLPVRAPGREGLAYLALASGGLALLLPPIWPWLEGVLRLTAAALRDAWTRLPAAVAVGASSAFVLAAAALASACVFDRIPHVQDSIAQLFQAHVFATWRAWAPPPAFPWLFDYPHLISAPRWFAQFQPGHPAVLAVGVLLGAPWLVNPLLGAAAVVAIYWLGREAYGDGVGRGGALLAAFSPFLVFMSAEYMNHSTALVCLCVYLAGIARLLRRGGGLPTAVVAGLAVGVAAATRLLTAFAVAAPLGLYLVAVALRGRRSLLVPALALVLGASVPLAGFLAFNHATTGKALTTGYEAKYGSQHNPGFGHSGWGPAHTPVAGLLNTASNLGGVERQVFAWPVPSLLFVAVLFLSRTRDRWDWLLAATWSALTAAYFFYWYQDLCFGPRFQYEALPVFVLLTARGLLRLPDVVREWVAPDIDREKLTQGGLILIALLTVVGLVVNVPPLVSEYRDAYWGVSGALTAELERTRPTNAIVLVSGEYGDGFLANFADGAMADGEIIAARNLAGAATALGGRYPGRRLYHASSGALVPDPTALDLVRAQVRDWDRQWTLVGGCDLSGTGLVLGESRDRAPGDPPLVLRTKPQPGTPGCAIERTVTLSRGMVLEVAVAATPGRGEAAHAWRLQAVVGADAAVDLVVPAETTGWLVHRWALPGPTGRQVTVRLQQPPEGDVPATASWAYARVTTERAGAGRPLLPSTVPALESGPVAER